jgi:hypothetical protein
MTIRSVTAIMAIVLGAAMIKGGLVTWTLVGSTGTRLPPPAA